MVNTVGKEISEADRAYLSGFLDGDGSIMAVLERHPGKKYGFRVRIIVKISQKDSKSLAWFSKTFKVGRIVSNNRSFDWIIKNQKDAKYLLKLMLPYLKTKYSQAKIACDILELNLDINSKDDFLHVSRLADSLSLLNVRSKNRRINNTAMVQDIFSRND